MPDQHRITPWDEARDLTDTQLREEVTRMAVARRGPRKRRELAFLDVLHQQHPEMCRCPARYTPHWLHERVEDPHGTPNRHLFWDDQPAERIGPWKMFERDGTWYLFETLQNAWAHFPGRAEAAAHAAGPRVDIWA
jgi:hypothetical protein